MSAPADPGYILRSRLGVIIVMPKKRHAGLIIMTQFFCGSLHHQLTEQQNVVDQKNKNMVRINGALLITKHQSEINPIRLKPQVNSRSEHLCR